MSQNKNLSYLLVFTKKEKGFLRTPNLCDNYSVKNQKPHFDYSRYECCKQVVFPLDIETIIPKDDSVRLLSLILEELNYSKLYEEYYPKGRNPVVDPKILFKILVYSCTQCIYSSRKIEKACRRDINFKFLLDG